MSSSELTRSLDDIFNKNYDRNNQLDSKINTNEDLIKTYMDAYEEQSLKNSSLQMMTLAAFLILIVVTLYYFGLIPSTMILMILVVSIIVLTMLVIYYQYYQTDYQSYLDRMNRATQKSLASNDVIKRPLGDELSCDPQTLEEEETYDDPTSRMNGKSMQASYDKLLVSDSNYDVWLNGDHRSSKAINENTKRLVDENIGNKNIKTSNDYDLRDKLVDLDSNYATYYDCEYTGTLTNGMPIKRKYEKSTIPCNYYINYKEIAKYKKDGSNFIKV